MKEAGVVLGMLFIGLLCFATIFAFLSGLAYLILYPFRH